MKTDSLPLQTYIAYYGPGRDISSHVVRVTAKSRNHAVSILRSRGIKPSHVRELTPFDLP